MGASVGPAVFLLGLLVVVGIGAFVFFCTEASTAISVVLSLI